MIDALCFPVVHYILKKLENLLKILENNLNTLEIQTNNNVKEQNQDYKNLSENGLICRSAKNYTMLTWILLFPLVICLHACHFWVNVSLFTIHKPPIEFEVIRWSLQNSRIKLMKFRITWLKKRKGKSKMSFYQLPYKLNSLIPLFLKKLSTFFIKKCRKYSYYLKTFLISSQTEQKSSENETFLFKKEHQATSVTEIPTPIISRRVSVTVQEIIFEETEDSF